MELRRRLLLIGLPWTSLRRYSSVFVCYHPINISSVSICQMCDFSDCITISLFSFCQLLISSQYDCTKKPSPQRWPSCAYNIVLRKSFSYFRITQEYSVQSTGFPLISTLQIVVELCIGSPSVITISASFPGSREPTRSAMPRCFAGLMVIA